MRRTELLAHLSTHGCRLEREGGRHSIWINPATGEIQAVPRHREIKKFIARSICRKLSIPEQPGA
ncbi:MAG TPA: type II toxin-antitoxin system HicA family toxin [Luteolibacter sp.]|nr:type II toxin-antitoxin system HicA family toxin [Luteolibacter sp.]